MMAMAELFIHEIEDPLTSYFPPAPPPSPEAQRARSNVFEIPASAFGPLDLRQQDFSSLDFILSGQKTSSPLSTVLERGSPYDDDDDMIDFPASPKKRLCNSPCSFPEGYDIQINDCHSGAKFTGNSAPHPKSKRHPHRSPVHSHSPPLLSVPKSNSPPHTQNQSSPHSIPHKPENGFTYTGYNHTLSPPTHLNIISKSFDLHNAHLFQGPSDFSMPEVRSRAYTHDATSLTQQVDSSQQRRRKISLKRTKDERDSDLQFSFEYSTNSTGSNSSEQDDWLVVTPDTCTALPIGKKACQDIHPQAAPSLPLTFASPEQQLYTAPSYYTTSLYNQALPPIEHTPNLISLESVTMMDTGEYNSLRGLDSIDSMECGGGGEQLISYTEMETQSSQAQLQVQNNNMATIRSHSTEDRQANFRYSFVQDKGINRDTLDVSNSGFNFSKSL